MSASQRLLLHKRLSARVNRDHALLDVAKLVRLLPGFNLPSTHVDWRVIPDEKPVIFDNVASVRRQFLSNNFLKKFKGFQAPEDPRSVAKKNFLRYEELCSVNNAKFRLMRNRITDPFLNDILFIAQRKIASVLGPFKVDELLSSARWGPGTTSSCKGRKVGSAEKFRSRPEVTGEFLGRARLLMPLLPSWSALLADADYGAIVNPIMPLVKGNKITFVPKTAKTDRTIAIEPHINVFFQNGLGRMIRRRMMQRAHVNLNDQTINQRLAALGSRDGSLATIDLEGASDTISKELVRDLLPEDWFSWLNATRSHFGTLDGEVIHYEKFASMGNGSTWDLESLIFWSLSSAVVEQLGYNSFWVNVFGDDIIVPSGCYNKVTEILESCGFLVNKAKSFHQGPFRESCGTDWFSGFNVRPVYLKDIPTRIVDWIIIANQIRLLSHRWCESSGCDISLKPAYDFCVSRIPRDLRLRVPAGAYAPAGYESLGLVSNFDEACPPKKSDCGWEGYWIRIYSVLAEKYRLSDRSLLTAGVHSLSQTGNELPLRDLVGFREESSFVASWYDLGPWK